MDDEHLMIRVLKFATSRVSFTLDELFKDLCPTDYERKQILIQIYHKQLFTHDLNGGIFSSTAHAIGTHNEQSVERQYKTYEQILFASADDHFRLIDYQELKEARANALSATKQSNLALLVSIAAMVISIVFSIASMTSDINLPDSLYQRLSSDSTRINDTLDKNTKYITNSIQDGNKVQSLHHQETMQALKSINDDVKQPKVTVKEVTAKH